MYVYVCMVLPLCPVIITLLYPTQCTTCFVHEAIKLFEFEFEYNQHKSIKVGIFAGKINSLRPSDAYMRH